MSAEKRPASNSFSSQQIVKKQKSDAQLGDSSALVNSGQQNGALITSGEGAGGLNAPVMELTGHTGEVFAARFNTSGQNIASGGMDRSIMLWRAKGDCQNYGMMKGHKGAILDLQWSRDPQALFSASADATIAIWDVETGQRLRRHIGHDDVINSIEVNKQGSEIVISGSDDGTVGLWDPRQKHATDYYETNLPITSVALPEAGHEIYVADISPDIKVYDVRKKSVINILKGHTDTVTSLQVSPGSQYLLSNSYDSTVRTWNILPFAPLDRHVQTYDGSQPGLDKNLYKAVWDTDGKRIAAGCGDLTVVVWDARTGKMLHKLPGHKGAVNDVRFSPAEKSLILSASTDSNLMLGELK